MVFVRLGDLQETNPMCRGDERRGEATKARLAIVGVVERSRMLDQKHIVINRVLAHVWSMYF